MNLQVGVKVLLRNSEDKYLFLRRTAAFQSGPQKWDIPDGRIEPEESLEAALRREVQEETSLTLESIDRLLAAQDIFVAAAPVHVVRLTYVGTASGEVAISDEHDSCAWMTKDEALASELDSYVREVFEGGLTL